MKKHFLDTNILIDFLAERVDFGVHALRIFNKALEGEWELWTSDSVTGTSPNSGFGLCVAFSSSPIQIVSRAPVASSKAK